MPSESRISDSFPNSGASYVVSKQDKLRKTGLYVISQSLNLDSFNFGGSNCWDARWRSLRNMKKIQHEVLAQASATIALRYREPRAPQKLQKTPTQHATNGPKYLGNSSFDTIR
ncbi:hypothetical protein ABW19_dt0209950 [Dactylella cylindrospora]|nr:hypothetical protein ABW19_dt0209950 [Dactylella cylindrospora]